VSRRDIHGHPVRERDPEPAEHQSEVEEPAPAHPPERAAAGEEVVTTTTPGPAGFLSGFVAMFVGLVTVAIIAVEAALSFRLAFLLANANPDAGFVNFIYNVTDPLVAPFQGIIADRAVNGGVFEPASVIAMAVYLVAALLVIGLLWALAYAPARSGRSTTVRRPYREDPHTH
jgi:uncharacterized protein YggT (Ycf19 family)